MVIARSRTRILFNNTFPNRVIRSTNCEGFSILNASATRLAYTKTCSNEVEHTVTIAAITASTIGDTLFLGYMLKTAERTYSIFVDDVAATAAIRLFLGFRNWLAPVIVPFDRFPFLRLEEILARFLISLRMHCKKHSLWGTRFSRPLRSACQC